MRRLLRELKRRKVYRVGAVYLVSAFVVVQLADLAVGAFELPLWFEPMVWVLCGLGFPPALVLGWAFHLTPEGVEWERGEASSGSGRSERTAVVDDGSPVAGEAVEGGDAAPTRSDDHSLAVLPFGNLSAAEENAYFAAGLHEEILTQLSKVGDLRVTSRTSVMAYRDSKKSLREIGRELGVRAVLEGSVQRVGERIRVTGQLIDARTDEHLWAHRYDRTVDDAFAIQTEIAIAITKALQATLTPQEQRRIEKKPTENTEAYRLYLQGRIHLERRGEEAMRRSIDYFRQAIELDPGYALAWAGLGHAFGYLADYGYADPREALPKAREAAHRAIDLDPELAEAHTTLALESIVAGDGPAALRRLRRAIELRPSYVLAHTGLSWIYQLLGRAQEAHESASRAVELDPVGMEASANQAMSCLITGDPETALAAARRVREIEPSYTSGPFYEGVVLYHLGRFAEAKSVLRGLSVKWSGSGPESTLALARLKSGDTAGARKMLAEFEKGDDVFAAGLVRAGFGEVEGAFEAFSKVGRWGGVGGFWPTLSLRHLYPDVLRPLRHDRRFNELLHEVNRSWGLRADGSR